MNQRLLAMGVLSMFSAVPAAERMASGRLAATAGRLDATPHAASIATQGIREHAADTLRPAALGLDGQLVAYVAHDRRTPPQRCCQNVYILDRPVGRITQESLGPDGTQPDGDSEAPSLSADGWILAFETLASNLLPGHPRPVARQVVVRDRQRGVWRTPASPLDHAPDGQTGEPAVAGDGTAVVFTSDATNLVAGQDANGHRNDVYRWRLHDGAIVRVSVDSHGVQPSVGASFGGSVSGDGDLVAFVSTARLAPEDTNDVADVFLRDLRRGVTMLVSRRADGKPSDGGSYSPALSADGGTIAFVSMAGNLAARDRNREPDVYLYDVATRSIALASRTSAGTAANAASGRPALSADGRYVVFQSVASNLGSGPACPPAGPDRNLLPDVYVLDRTTGCLTRISGSPGREWWTPSIAPAIDASGAVVVFSSTQPSSDGDPSTDFDLFLFRRP